MLSMRLYALRIAQLGGCGKAGSFRMDLLSLGRYKLSTHAQKTSYGMRINQ
jgi:hypothetical protein